MRTHPTRWTCAPGRTSSHSNSRAGGASLNFGSRVLTGRLSGIACCSFVSLLRAFFLGVVAMFGVAVAVSAGLIGAKLDGVGDYSWTAALCPFFVPMVVCCLLSSECSRSPCVAESLSRSSPHGLVCCWLCVPSRAALGGQERGRCRAVRPVCGLCAAAGPGDRASGAAGLLSRRRGRPDSRAGAGARVVLLRAGRPAGGGRAVPAVPAARRRSRDHRV